MSYKVHIASKYDVEWGGAFTFDDFEQRLGWLREAMTGYNINGELTDRGFDFISYDDNETWWEFYKPDMLKFIEVADLGEHATEIKDFVKMLVDSSDPNFEYVHLEAW